MMQRNACHLKLKVKRRYYVGPLTKRSTIIGVYNANLLNQLRTAIREKRRGKLSKGVLLQQDNVRVHTCKVAMDAVKRDEYKLYTTSCLFADLAPSASLLFRIMKKDIISGLT